MVQYRGVNALWKSKKQALVTLSTPESELVASCEAVVLGQSLEALVNELTPGPIRKRLQVDNTAAICLAEGGGSQRTRHLKVRRNFLKDQRTGVS